MPSADEPPAEALTVADCGVAFETDFQLFQKFGSSTLLTNYVTGLVAAVSDQYFTDVQTRVSIAYLGIHTTSNDGWNAQDEEIFVARHKPDVIVRWPGQPEPTRGIDDHLAESIAFWKMSPDQHLDNRPYRIFFASGAYTCSVARFRGAMTGPMVTADGNEIPPTGKSFDVDFYTVAQWDDGQIVEEAA